MYNTTCYDVIKAVRRQIQLSTKTPYLLKRLAWCRKQPMTKTVEALVMKTIRKLSPADICGACKSEKSQCKYCFITIKHRTPEPGSKYESW